MNNTIKILLSSLSYDNLKIATLLIASGTFVMLKLFGLAPLSPFVILPFDDVLGSNSNIFFTYFLDFSGVLSSILLVGIIVFFIMFQLVMMSSYMNDQSKKWLILVLIAGLGFYGWVSTINPVIEKFENRFLTSFKVGSMVYSNKYVEAYGIVAAEKINPLEKAYLNVQISADQFKQIPNRDNEMLLKADTTQLDSVIKQNDSNIGQTDANVLYKIYNLSNSKDELPELKAVAEKIDQKVVLYSVLAALLYLSALYNIYIYRAKMGMTNK
ncbi:hypothetical protein IRT38_00505 (plasmid) [Acinetobacter sp. SK-43]|uniref:hypothetical protein n=1 Tax=Acinetobacter sp. SK-43 TaxID=2785295 RepID=UPI00188A13BA|nr:hypothetical protein [Acinetobacter sp. SK-43]MBF4453895.1 hypothetical protein [Acinetobacter sp. SK-43]